MKLRKSLLLVSAALFAVNCANISKESLQTQGSDTATNGGGGAPTYTTGLYVFDAVIAAPGHTGSGVCNQANAVNGIRGAGWGAGSFDVFSLDNPGGTACSGASTHLTLRLNGKKVLNGSGADFIVYENGFYISGNPSTRFMDLIIVEVSNDDAHYCGFAPDYTYTPETSYSNNPAYWQRFAGKTPVNYNVDVAARNYTVSELFTDADADKQGDLGGGDLFDLDDLSDSDSFGIGCSTALRDELKTNGFTYLRLTPAARRNNPDTGAAFVKEPISNGPDIDGAVARYAE
ncbi:MAG: LIC_13355 family lipoprotein [Turneriella sp.]